MTLTFKQTFSSTCLFNHLHGMLRLKNPCCQMAQKKGNCPQEEIKFK